MGRDHRNPWEVLSQVYADGLRRTCDIAPSRVSVPHADHPEGQRIHGPGEGGLVEQVSAKINATGDNIREAAEATGPRIQEGRARDTEPKRSGQKNPQNFTDMQQTPVGVPDHRRVPLHIRT